MVCTDIMKDQSEVVYYTLADLPVYIATTALSEYPKMQALCHWHEDIEFIQMLEGSMNYYVNGKKVLLKEKDCLMVNTRQLHYGYSFYSRDCRFTCVLFHPGLFKVNEDLYRKYILPVMDHPGLEYLHFKSGTRNGAEAAAFLDEIVLQKEKAAPGSELETAGILYRLWNWLFKYVELLPPGITEASFSDLTVQKDMVSFIYQNYREKLTLADIAASGHVCRSKCCAIFKRYLQQSPIDFLNSYRLKVSCDCLVKTEDSITQIAFSCGFNHLSYFSELFLRSFGYTPSEYRKIHKASGRDETGGGGPAI